MVMHGRSNPVALATLIALAVLITAGLAWLHAVTADKISLNQRAFEMRQIRNLLQHTDYDNDVFTNLIWVNPSDPDATLLGTGGRHYICRATQNNSPVAAVIQATAERGYNGSIGLMVAVRLDGTLAGVRVTDHRETPGLGDRIESNKSSWLKQFEGRSLRDPSVDRWQVKKDGGEFDQLTGATITPRAVVSSVRDALVYFEAHRTELFTRPANTGTSTGEHDKAPLFGLALSSPLSGMRCADVTSGTGR